MFKLFFMSINFDSILRFPQVGVFTDRNENLKHRHIMSQYLKFIYTMFIKRCG